MIMRTLTFAIVTALGFGTVVHPSHTAARLQLEIIGSDSTAFDVVSVIVSGPTEAILWDAQYHARDARRVADRLASSGKHLKAIVLSHADHDHFLGATTIVERFPGTPVYMTPAALAEYRRTVTQVLENERRTNPGETPDSAVTPQLLPSNRLTVDGEVIEVVPDLTGDVQIASNSFLWIPSLRTALAGDIIFNEVHPWLGASDSTTRQAWRRALQRIADLKPAAVVAGHKRVATSPDSPELLVAMRQYLDDFDALRKTSANAADLVSAMVAKYPTYAVAGLLRFAARQEFAKTP